MRVRARKLAEDSVVILDTEEWGTCQLEPCGFNDTMWWFITMRDREEWIVWYCGDSDTRHAALENHVIRVSDREGPIMFSSRTATQLHSLDMEGMA